MTSRPPYPPKRPTSFLSLPRELRQDILLQALRQKPRLPGEEWIRFSLNISNKQIDQKNRRVLVLFEQKTQEAWLRTQIKAIRAAILGKSVTNSLLLSREIRKCKQRLEGRMLEDLDWAERKLETEMAMFWSVVWRDALRCGVWEILHTSFFLKYSTYQRSRGRSVRYDTEWYFDWLLYRVEKERAGRNQCPLRLIRQHSKGHYFLASHPTTMKSIAQLISIIHGGSTLAF